MLVCFVNIFHDIAVVYIAIVIATVSYCFKAKYNFGKWLPLLNEAVFKVVSYPKIIILSSKTLASFMLF